MLLWRKLVRYSVPSQVVSRILRRNMAEFQPKSYFVWMDLEMTGLNEKIHHIIEVACTVTNINLDKIGDGIHLIVHQPKEVHDQSESWSLNQHEKSGLRDSSINSKISIQEADKRVSDYIQSCIKHKDNSYCYLAGNSVYMDKRFIEKYMPLVNSFLHYRILDVTSIKILYSNWCSRENFKKKSTHRANEDVEATMEELKFYRKFFIKNV